MTPATLTERPLFANPSPELGSVDVWRSPKRFDGGGLTLEEKLDCVWEGLHAVGLAACPVCDSQMAAGEPSSCADCGSRLA